MVFIKDRHEPRAVRLGQWLTLRSLTDVSRVRSQASAHETVCGHQVGQFFFFSGYSSFPIHVKYESMLPMAFVFYRPVKYLTAESIKACSISISRCFVLVNVKIFSCKGDLKRQKSFSFKLVSY